MAILDNEDFRGFLTRIYPGLVIDDVPAPSGQRVVYFCHFEPDPALENEWPEWGNVVLKVSEGVSAQAIAYIQREIEILNRLAHPGYPTLLYDDVISEDPDTEVKLNPKLFVTIEERIDAQPLSELAENFCDENSVIDLLTKLILILKPLWEGRPPLVHRDLKPANILITPSNDVVVIDLGIVREEGASGVTFSAVAHGPCTPKYASPEQAINDKRNISFKSDFFALATLCYELLTGSNPYQEEDDLVEDVLDKVCNKIPESLHSLGLASEDFSRIIQKMMEKHPYKRHRKIEDLVVEIEAIRS
ncbi:MAG: protein kinase [Candidatus Thiodiazotropha sp. (ex Monitilora ramsayi)]|nr:protein kinase [Candidatus Thiodiazotropha sp. (ex Monitilora ramsayi)]